MTTPALIVLETRDTGESLITYFGISHGHEYEAALQLLNHVQAGAEVWLRNSPDEGHEGCTQLRRGIDGFETAMFGHGWSGKWSAIDEQWIPAVVDDLAKLNRGTHCSQRGSIHRSKSKQT